MNSAIKIIKRGKSETVTEVRVDQGERSGAQSTREMVRTVKGWISELQQRRRDEKLQSLEQWLSSPVVN